MSNCTSTDSAKFLLRTVHIASIKNRYAACQHPRNHWFIDPNEIRERKVSAADNISDQSGKKIVSGATGAPRTAAILRRRMWKIRCFRFNPAASADWTLRGNGCTRPDTTVRIALRQRRETTMTWTWLMHRLHEEPNPLSHLPFGMPTRNLNRLRTIFFPLACPNTDPHRFHGPGNRKK